MPTRFREWQFRRRIELGAQFFVTGPILDPEVLERYMGRLKLKPEDPPIYVMIIPPFSPLWVEQMEQIGSVPASDGLKQRLAELAPDVARKVAWELTAELETRAREAGAAGVILMGLKYDSVVGEAVDKWLRRVEA
jgi:5,10-methylenetetrahydrofolate reductase